MCMENKISTDVWGGCCKCHVYSPIKDHWFIKILQHAATYYEVDVVHVGIMGVQKAGVGVIIFCDLL